MMIFRLVQLASLFTLVFASNPFIPATSESEYPSETLLSFPQSAHPGSLSHVFNLGFSHTHLIQKEVAYSSIIFQFEELKVLKNMLEIISADDPREFSHYLMYYFNNTFKNIGKDVFVSNSLHGYKFYLIRYIILFGASKISERIYSQIENRSFQYGLITTSTLRYLIATKPINTVLKILAAYKVQLKSLGLLEYALNSIKDRIPKDSYFHAKFMDLFNIEKPIKYWNRLLSEQGDSETDHIKEILRYAVSQRFSDIALIYPILKERLDLMEELSDEFRFMYLAYFISIDDVDMLKILLYKYTEIIYQLGVVNSGTDFERKVNLVDVAVDYKAKKCFALLVTIVPEMLTATMGKPSSSIEYLIRSSYDTTMVDELITLGFDLTQLTLTSNDKTYNMIQYSFKTLVRSFIEYFIRKFGREFYMEQIKILWPTAGDIILYSLKSLGGYKEIISIFLDTYGFKLSDQYEYEGQTGNALIFISSAPNTHKRFMHLHFSRMIEKELRTKNSK